MICENCMLRLIQNIKKQKKDRHSIYPSIFSMCTNMRLRDTDNVYYSLCTEQTEKAWEAVITWVENPSAK